MSLEDLVRRYTKPMSPIPTDMRETGGVKGEIQAVLFDVYGTLFISKAGDISIAEEGAEKDIKKIEKLLARFHINKRALHLHREFFEEIEGEKNRRRLCGVDVPEVEIEKIWKRVLSIDDEEIIRRFAMEYELIVNPIYPMPHAKELLSSLRERHIPMGIISNAQFYTPYLFSALLGAPLYELGFRDNLIFFSYVFGYGKPSLYLFEKAVESLEKSSIPKDAVLYVGNDMLKDIYPASAVGFQTVFFAGDGRSLRLREGDERCLGVIPDLVITDLLSIMDYI